MWYNILPALGIVTGCVAVGGYGLWWMHYLVLGNTAWYFAIMWYEILPSAMIIGAGLGLPAWGLYHIHNLVLGNHFRRTLIDRWDRCMYHRDLRINGNPYNPVGLEAIPDVKDKKKASK